MTNKKANLNNSGNAIIAELNAKLKILEEKVSTLEGKNLSLELKAEELESRNVISERVNSELAKEIDKLSQYTRRHNVVIRTVFLPETETNDDVEKEVKKLITKDLQLPDEVKILTSYIGQERSKLRTGEQARI